MNNEKEYEFSLENMIEIKEEFETSFYNTDSTLKDNKKECEFGLESVNEIKKECETSFYQDKIVNTTKDLGNGSIRLDLGVPFCTNDTDISSSFVLPDEVSTFINNDNSESEFSDIIHQQSETTFLTKEMLRENKLFSKASEFDKEENEICDYNNSEPIPYQGLEKRHIDKESEIYDFNNSEPIPYQGPARGIFDRLSKQKHEELDTNCMSVYQQNSIVKSNMITTDTPFQRNPYEFTEIYPKNNDCNSQVIKSSTNLFQIASDNLKSGKKFDPLFPTSGKKNSKPEETPNSQCLDEQERENIKDQVTTDLDSESSTKLKPQLKKPSFKPVFKKPKKSTLANSSKSSVLGQNNNECMQQQSMSQTVLNVKGKEKEKNNEDCIDTFLDIKEESVTDKTDASSTMQEASTPKVVKQTVMNVSNTTKTTSCFAGKNNKSEKVAPSKLYKNHIDHFKNKFSYLYSVKQSNTNEMMRKEEIKRDVKKMHKKANKIMTKVNSKTVKDKEATSKRLPSISVKSVENLNSTPFSNVEIKDEPQNEHANQNESQLIPEHQNNESCLSIETSHTNNTNDIEPLTSSSSFEEKSNVEIKDEPENEHANQNESQLIQEHHNNESCLSMGTSHTNNTNDIEPLTSSSSSEEKSNGSLQDSFSETENFANQKRILPAVKTKRFVCETKIKAKKFKPSKKSESVNVGNVEMLKKKLYDLQAMTNYPVWVCCDVCSKWRCLRDTLDPTEVPKFWICSMNPDEVYASCNAPEEKHDDETFAFIYNKFTLGSLVWVTNQGPDWWPAMVDDCPDNHLHYWLEEPYEKPTQYHVTFFGTEATRAWVPTRFLRKFTGKSGVTVAKDKKMRKEYAIAVAQAEEAYQVDLPARRKKYCFATRRKGKWFLKKGDEDLRQNEETYSEL